jgi:hypothetical protein
VRGAHGRRWAACAWGSLHLEKERGHWEAANPPRQGGGSIVERTCPRTGRGKAARTPSGQGKNARADSRAGPGRRGPTLAQNPSRASATRCSPRPVEGPRSTQYSPGPTRTSPTGPAAWMWPNTSQLVGGRIRPRGPRRRRRRRASWSPLPIHHRAALAAQAPESRQPTAQSGSERTSGASSERNAAAGPWRAGRGPIRHQQKLVRPCMQAGLGVRRRPCREAAPGRPARRSRDVEVPAELGKSRFCRAAGSPRRPAADCVPERAQRPPGWRRLRFLAGRRQSGRRRGLPEPTNDPPSFPAPGSRARAEIPRPRSATTGPPAMGT